MNKARETLNLLSTQKLIENKTFRLSGRELCTCLHDLRMVVLNETNLPFDLSELDLDHSSEPASISDIFEPNKINDEMKFAEHVKISSDRNVSKSDNYNLCKFIKIRLLVN